MGRARPGPADCIMTGKDQGQTVLLGSLASPALQPGPGPLPCDPTTVIRERSFAVLRGPRHSRLSLPFCQSSLRAWHGEGIKKRPVPSPYVKYEMGHNTLLGMKVLWEVGRRSQTASIP